MKESKFAKQFKEVIDHSSKKIDNCFCLQISSESASIYGVSKKMLAPQSAIILIQHDKQTYVKGCFDDVLFESSSIEDLDAAESILVGVDCRSKENNIIYYKAGETFGKVSKDSIEDTYDTLYIYWEYGPNACLTVCSYDPIVDAVVREVVSASNEPMKRFLRAIVRQALPPFEKEEENHDNPFDIIDDSEEGVYYETVSDLEDLYSL